MLLRLLFLVVVIGFSSTVNAQAINLRGKVSDESGKAIAGAVVTLVGQGQKDTTGADGSYAITVATAVKMPLLQPSNESILPVNGGLAFALPKPSAVTIRIFDINSRLLKRIFCECFHRFLPFRCCIKYKCVQTYDYQSICRANRDDIPLSSVF